MRGRGRKKVEVDKIARNENAQKIKGECFPAEIFRARVVEEN